MTTQHPKLKFIIREPDLGQTTMIYQDRGRLLKPRAVNPDQFLDIEFPPHYLVTTFDNEVVIEVWTTLHYADQGKVFSADQTAEAYQYAYQIARERGLTFKATKAPTINDNPFYQLAGAAQCQQTPTASPGLT